MGKPGQRAFIRFRKDLTRSLIDHHVWRAIESGAICGRVLNVGGGNRTYAEQLRCVGDARVIVTDWPNSPTRNRVHIHCDAHRLPFADGAFDSILCTEVLEHLQEPLAALKEMSRVLRGGGSLLLTTPFQYQAHQRPFDYFRFTYDGLDMLARESGFASLEVWRRGDSLAVALNALKVFARQRRWPGSGRALEFAEKIYLKWYGRRSLEIPLCRDPMALGYTVLARKAAGA